MKKMWAVHGALALVGFIYGANYIIAKGVMPDYLGPNAFIVIRVGIAAILFWIYHAVFIREKLKYTRDLIPLAKCAFFGVAANQLMFFNGLNLGSPVNASIIMTMTPIFVLVISYLWFKERISKNKLLGILFGATGAVLLVTDKPISFSNDTFLGDLFVIGNATSYAIYLVMVRPLMQRYEAATVVKWIFILGFFMTLPFGAVSLYQTEISTIPFSIWGSVAYVIIGTTFLAYLLNAMALRHVSSAVVGYYIYIQPVVSTFIAISIGHENFMWSKILYALLIFTGVYLVSKKEG